ncbi:hypothetical protein FRC03_009341 [Tulasnella sp. 419]|nr:hypothetical protein FRC03_009341 [Tulasnella sp. 419]
MGKGKRPAPSSSQTVDDDAEILLVDDESPHPPRTLGAKTALGEASSPTGGLGPPSKRAKVIGGTSMSKNLKSAAPLAERLRPTSLEEFVGHEHLTGKDSLLRSLLEGGGTGSMILWGPAGCGKTTLARLMAKRTNSVMKELSATSSGTAEVRQAFDDAKNSLVLTGRRTILFMDEIHRFNKSQQDLFLPYVEQGLVQLIGATTENPSFKLNNALLSRCRVFVLERLTDENIRTVLDNALRRITSEGENTSAPSTSEEDQSRQMDDSSTSSLNVQKYPTLPQITDTILESITSLSTGDARTALSLLELAVSSPKSISPDTLLNSLRKSVIARYDRTGDDRYDMISALHKSVRGSDGDAAMYWLSRMLTAGEDPLYIARRMIVMASEDIGLANNDALPLAIACYNACTIVGMPECRINLAHCAAYLAESPKSTRSYEAYNAAEDAANADPSLPVPIHIRNAPTGLMKDLGYGAGYNYNPRYRHPVHNEYLPIQITGMKFLRKEGDLTGKEWDEDLLCNWEWKRNAGNDWEGRPSKADSETIAADAPRVEPSDERVQD